MPKRWPRSGKRGEEIPEFCSEVRRLTDRVGEVLNLKDKESQRRSLAALLAKKHWKPRTQLSRLYSLSKTRELTLKECLDVFRLVCWRHGDEDGT